MPIVTGFVAPVKTAEREAFTRHCEVAAAVLIENGALQIAENWGDDVPEGELTSFTRAVALEPGETVVFSWIVWPDRATADAAMGAMMADPRMAAVSPPPFDGARAIFGTFELLLEARRDGADGAAVGYVDGFVAAVPTASRAAYVDHAAKCAPVFHDAGALTLVECWGTDVPDGQRTSLPMAVRKAEDETVVFSWIVWPDRGAREAGMKQVFADPRIKPDVNPMPFDGRRLIYGGFETLLDVRATASAPARCATL